MASAGMKEGAYLDDACVHAVQNIVPAQIATSLQRAERNRAESAMLAIEDLQRPFTTPVVQRQRVRDTLGFHGGRRKAE
jgi:hypothetical protein